MQRQRNLEVRWNLVADDTEGRPEPQGWPRCAIQPCEGQHCGHLQACAVGAALLLLQAVLHDMWQEAEEEEVREEPVSGVEHCQCVGVVAGLSLQRNQFVHLMPHRLSHSLPAVLFIVVAAAASCWQVFSTSMSSRSCRNSKSQLCVENCYRCRTAQGEEG